MKNQEVGRTGSAPFPEVNIVVVVVMVVGADMVKVILVIVVVIPKIHLATCNGIKIRRKLRRIKEIQIKKENEKCNSRDDLIHRGESLL